MVAFIVIELRVREPMLDLKLLRVPTFNGGLVSAWAVSASIFSMLTYLVIYFQDVLGYSAVAAGVRFLPLTGAVFLVAGIAGRLTTKVPIRLLIGGGFAFVVAGLLLMRGLTASDSWTHFLPGFILAGIGAGFINVPLASTAVGVVTPERAGMASGINSTLRQVGIATGVAALGTILASQIRSEVISHLAGTPLAAHSHQLATAISAGGAGAGDSARPTRGPGPGRRRRQGQLCRRAQHDPAGRRRRRVHRHGRRAGRDPPARLPGRPGARGRSRGHRASRRIAA